MKNFFEFMKTIIVFLLSFFIFFTVFEINQAWSRVKDAAMKEDDRDGSVSPTEDPPTLPALEGLSLHGFISQGAFVTSHSNYLADKSQEGSYDFTETGISLIKMVDARTDLGFQLFSRKIGDTGDFDIKFDWFFLDYRWSNLLGIKIGRVKIPFGLYNDSSDIDSARVPVLLPQSIYSIQSRDYLLASTGAQVYGHISLDDQSGSLEYTVYGGTIHLDIPESSTSGVTINSITVPYLIGTRVLWESPNRAIRTGVSVQQLRIESDLTLGSSTALTLSLPATLYVGSLEYSKEKWQISAEYSRWYIDLQSSKPSLYSSTSTISERYYLMSNYYLSETVSLGSYYSYYISDTAKNATRDNQQHDWALYTRKDITNNWLLKLEGHYFYGTAALSSTLNGGQSTSSLHKNWMGLFLKTTVTF